MHKYIRKIKKIELTVKNQEGGKCSAYRDTKVVGEVGGMAGGNTGGIEMATGCSVSRRREVLLVVVVVIGVDGGGASRGEDFVIGKIEKVVDSKHVRCRQTVHIHLRLYISMCECMYGVYGDGQGKGIECVLMGVVVLVFTL